MARDPKRAKAYQKGITAEHRVREHLETIGFNLLQQRYKTKYGEIDLIMRLGDLIVFLEVKARASVEEALQAVTARTQRRIIDSAEAWISTQSFIGEDVVFRFDVAAVTADGTITLYENAFETAP